MKAIANAIVVAASALCAAWPAVAAPDIPEWNACRGVPSYSADRAIAACTAIIERSGADRAATAEAFARRAAAFFFKGEFDSAIADADRATALAPDYWYPIYTRALARAAKGDYDRSIADFDRAIALQPNDFGGYHARGIVYRDKGDLDRALADFDRALALKPDFRPALMDRANVHRLKGQYDRAIADYDRAIALKPDQADAYAARGRANVDKGDTDSAIADYTKAIALKQAFPEAYAGRGDVYYKLRQYDRAIADYTQALALKPDFADALISRADAYDELKQTDRALADYDRAIAIKPTARAYYNRGNLHGDKGDNDRAIADYTQALALKPNDPLALNNRGNAYLEKGDADRAIADFSRAIELEPLFSTAINNRSRAYFAKQDYDRAIADAQRVMSIDVTLTGAQTNLKQAQDAKAALAARAQAERTANRIALVIGNAIYANAPPLPNAANDADDVAAELKKLGYEVFGSPKTDFTKAELAAMIDVFQRKAVTAEDAVVWYAGHGKEMREADNEAPRDWIIPVDAKINSKSDVARNALLLDKLQISVLAAKRLRLVVVDACRDNTFYSDSRGAYGFNRPASLPGVMVVYSTAPGDQAQDGAGRNSPFAQAFLEAVRANPNADVRQLFGTVTGRTNALTRGEQKPQTFSDLTIGDTLSLAPRQ